MKHNANYFKLKWVMVAPYYFL